MPTLSPVCLFDIDGTLIQSGGAGVAALRIAMQREFGVADALANVATLGRTDRGIGRAMFQQTSIPETVENWQRLCRAYLIALEEELPRRLGSVLPGISELLAELADRRFDVGLLTGNLRLGAERKLGHFGIWKHFQFGGFGDEHFDRDGVAREALAAAASHLKRDLSAADVWVIGDTPLDVACARVIGARAIAVATGGVPRAELEETAPDLLVDDFSDLAPVLALWA